MAGTPTISADTVCNREAEFLIASASRLENIKHSDETDTHRLADALADNLHIWNLIVERLMSGPNRAFPSTLCLQTSALAATVLRYTHAALEQPAPHTVHILVNLNRELAAEFCVESNFVT